MQNYLIYLSLFIFSACGVRFKETEPTVQNFKEIKIVEKEEIVIIPNAIFINSIVNESVEFPVVIKNNTSKPLNNVTTVLLNSYPEITVLSNSCPLQTLYPQETCHLNFKIHSANVIQRNTTLKASSGGYSANASFIFKAISKSEALVINNALKVINQDEIINDNLSNYKISGTAASYSIEQYPANGIISLNPNGSFFYMPNPLYSGIDSFTFKALNNLGESNTATYNIIINDVASEPYALSFNLSTYKNTPIPFTLVGFDDDSRPLSYTIVSPPQNGTLSGIGPNKTYSPNNNFLGNDTFTYKVSNGFYESNIATVNLFVVSNNQAPIASNSNIMVSHNLATPFSLNAADPNGDLLSYTVITSPAHGTISGTGSNLVYTPTLNYTGVDSLTFKVNDGFLDSNVATVSFTIVGTTTPQNNPPVANSQNLSIIEDSSTSVTLSGVDPENSSLAFILETLPLHGTLSGQGKNLTYTPYLNFNGTDSFSFKVNDGVLNSSAATITIQVTPVNDGPQTIPLSFVTPEDTSYSGTLLGSDVDGDNLTYTIVSGPLHGELTIINYQTGNFIYKPELNYTGLDSFMFKVNDGLLDSNFSLVSITVSGVNDAPVAQNKTLSVLKDSQVSSQVLATDIDSSQLTYILVSPPLHGELTLNVSGGFTYKPTEGYVGSDSFSFKANDSSLDSNIANVVINVVNFNTAPVAENLSLTAYLDQPIQSQVTASDIDGDSLIYSLITPIPGLNFNNNGTFTYQGSSSSNTVTFSYKAWDGQAYSNTATVSITVKLRDHNFKIVTNPFLVPHSLQGFPLLIDLQTIAHLNHFWENIQPNGGDLIVTLDDKITRVPVDLRHFNKVTRTGQLWFKSNILAATKNKFYIHYNSLGSPQLSLPLSDSAFGSYAVWGENYVGVWDMHLAASGILDATKKKNHAIGVESPNPLSNGFSDEAVKLNLKACAGMKEDYEGDCDKDKDFFYVTNNSSLQIDKEVTISAWVYPILKHNNAVILRKETKDGRANYELKLNKLKPSFIFEYKDPNKSLAHDKEIPLKQWTHLVGTFNPVTKKSLLYINGVLVKEESITPNESYATLANNLELGNKRFRGYMDEVKLSNKHLSKEWIITEYQMYDQANTFWLIEDENVIFADSFNRTDSNTVANSWLELEGCSESSTSTLGMLGSLGINIFSIPNKGCGYVKVEDNQLRFYELNNSIGYPEVKKTWTSISNGKIFLSFNVDFFSKSSKKEENIIFKDGKKLDNDFAVVMNFGDQTKAIGELVWGTRVAGLATNKGLGVVNKSDQTIAQIKRVNNRELVVVTIDFSQKTFSVFLKGYRLQNIPFTEPSSILNRISLIVNDTHSGYVPRIYFDNLVIKK